MPFAGFGFFEFLFPRHRVSRTRRTLMGVRIVLADKEPIGAALRRLKKLLERSGLTYDLRRHEAFHKPTQERRSKAFKKRFKAMRLDDESGLSRAGGKKSAISGITPPAGFPAEVWEELVKDGKLKREYIGIYSLAPGA